MKDSRPPRDPKPTRTAGRSADARGETGTDADLVGAPTRQTGDVGGIPATADSGLADRAGGPAGRPVGPPTDRSKVRQDGPGASTPPTTPAEPNKPRAETDEQGPLEALGKAISAPVRGADDDLASDEQAAARGGRPKRGPRP